MSQVCCGSDYWKQWLGEQDSGWKCDMGFSASQLLDMLNKPAKGNEFLMLVHQFVTASLNEGLGCIMPPPVKEAYDSASAHLTAFQSSGSGITDDRMEILKWKNILALWNENKSNP